MLQNRYSTSVSKLIISATFLTDLTQNAYIITLVKTIKFWAIYSLWFGRKYFELHVNCGCCIVLHWKSPCFFCRSSHVDWRTLVGQKHRREEFFATIKPTKSQLLSALQTFRTTEIFYACRHQTILSFRDLFVFRGILLDTVKLP